MKTLYSVGFLHNDHNIVLIKKKRPEWQAGYLNGVGGHVEENETPRDCMIREFKEETSVYVPTWEFFLKLEGDDAEIYFFAAYDTGGWINQVKTTTDEEIVIKPLSDLDGWLVVPNLTWIIPLMRQRGKYETASVKFFGDS